MSKDIREIVADWLDARGYDGLAGDECGCLNDDIMPCDHPSLHDCVPGYRVPCKCGGWRVVPEKPAEVSDE